MLRTICLYPPRITDPKGLATEYHYSGLGDLEALDSPDTGETVYLHDAAGRVT